VFPGYAKWDCLAALAEGALVPAPIVRTVSCYETRRAGEGAREKIRELERERERERERVRTRDREKS